MGRDVFRAPLNVKHIQRGLVRLNRLAPIDHKAFLTMQRHLLRGEGPKGPRRRFKRNTVSDWNFESAWDTYWTLDTVIYHGAPSSLICMDGTRRAVVCNYPGTTKLPNGRVESWFYKNGTAYTRAIGFCCRVQYPTWGSKYWVYQDISSGSGNSTIYFMRGVSELKSASIAQPPCNAWFLRRLTWWASGAWFILRFERWTGSAWVNDAGDGIDTSPLWGDSDVNRCGLLMQGHPSEEFTRADDTSIYG